MPTIKQTQRHNAKLLDSLKQKIAKQKKIKIAFFIVNELFVAEPLFQKMLNDDLFDPYIVIIPGLGLLYQDMSCLKRIYEKLVERYDTNHVVPSWNKDSDNFIDYNGKYDIICTSIPYIGSTHYYYDIPTIRKYALVIYFDYGYIISNHYFKYSSAREVTNVLYKSFALTDFAITPNNQYNTITKPFGYAKMDILGQIQRIKQGGRYL